MVRINLINPKYLTDQHLIAEYTEILMLVGYVKKYPKTSLEKIPKRYTLGKGHMLFFKNKLKYLKERFGMIKKEMKNRGFSTNMRLELTNVDKKLINGWSPKPADKEVIKKRIIEKINLREGYYRYYGDKKTNSYLKQLIKNAK